MEEHLVTAARFLSVRAEFTTLDSKLIVVFEDPDVPTSRSTHFVQPSQGLSLSLLQDTDLVFHSVIQDKFSAEDGLENLKALANQPPIHSTLWKLAFAFGMGFSVCSIGFAGSPADMLISGVLMMGLVTLQITGGSDVLFQGVSESVTISAPP